MRMEEARAAGLGGNFDGRVWCVWGEAGNEGRRKRVGALRSMRQQFFMHGRWTALRLPFFWCSRSHETNSEPHKTDITACKDVTWGGVHTCHSKLHYYPSFLRDRDSVRSLPRQPPWQYVFRQRSSAAATAYR